MDFGSLLSVAQKNAKTTVRSEGSRYYSTKFEPPKKVTKEKKLSDGIRRFLAQKEQDEREEKKKKKQEYEQLMSMRTDRDKNKIRKMLKVTKSANRSVLDDAVNKTDTAVTMNGPEQPDEDDYGYTSIESDTLYKSLMDKYSSMPEDKKFAKSAMSGNRNIDLKSTKDRVRAAILQEKEDEKMGRKRTHTSGDSHRSSASASSSSSDPAHRSRKNLYDPKAEREAEERKKKQEEDERRQKMRNKRPPPPIMDFQKLLKLAEEKQHEPIKVEVPQKAKEPERLLTSKEKREIEQKKKEMEERERRKNGLPPSKAQTNGKTEAHHVNGRIPKLNGANKSSAPDARKLSSTTARDPSRPTSSGYSNKMPMKSPPSMSKQGSSSKSSASQMNGHRPVDLKSKNQSHDTERSLLKNALSKQSKPIDSKNVKSRDFPPRDLVKTRDFPPKDVRAREFPPRDMIKSREFPPRDMARSRDFPPRDMYRSQASMKQKQSAASKRRILDDSEDEYDSEMDDFIDDDDCDNDYSSEIKKIFNYDKSRYRDEDEDCDNMESNFAQQQREEFVSKKIGLAEDLEDMRLEAEEKKRKAAKRRRL